MSRLPSEYTIQEASAKLGVPVQKLRRWDSQGVLVAGRTDGGHRRYSREIIDGLAGSSLGVVNDRYEDELATARKTLREKRRIIQLLLESESRYRDLVETSHDLIWTTDAQGRFTYLNKGALDIFGLQPKDLIGRCFFDFEARPSHISNRRFLSALRNTAKSRTTSRIWFRRRQRPLGRHQCAGLARRKRPELRASAAPRATSPSSTWPRCRSSIWRCTTR